MKRIIFYLYASLLLVSCDQITGSGNIVSETRDTGGFEGIEVGGAFTVDVKIGAETRVEVESDDNIISLIETRVSKDILRIRMKSGNNFHDGHYRVMVTVPYINSIRSSGASKVKATGVLKDSRKISLDASGAASILAAVDAPEIIAEVSGAADIELSGRTRSFIAEVSGSGNLKSGDLSSENTEVAASGAGTARVHASVNLVANASGAGTVYYRGGANVQQKTSGAGNVKAQN